MYKAYIKGSASFQALAHADAIHGVSPLTGALQSAAFGQAHSNNRCIRAQWSPVLFIIVQETMSGGDLPEMRLVVPSDEPPQPESWAGKGRGEGDDRILGQISLELLQFHCFGAESDEASPVTLDTLT